MPSAQVFVPLPKTGLGPKFICKGADLLNPGTKKNAFNSIFRVKFSADDIWKSFFFLIFPRKFDISCKLFLKDTICMKCQTSFSGRNKVFETCLLKF